MSKNTSDKNNSKLECSLPESLEKSLREYIQGEKDGVSYLDCLWGELYGSINSNYWGGKISQEQAEYLRATYLFGTEENEMTDSEEHTEQKM